MFVKLFDPFLKSSFEKTNRHDLTTSIKKSISTEIRIKITLIQENSLKYIFFTIVRYNLMLQ